MLAAVNPHRSLEEGVGAGHEVSPHVSPSHFPWKRPLSGCQPWRRSVPTPGPDHRQPRWATARPGGDVLSPPAPLRLALRTPPRPQIQATTEASSKQVRSFSPPDQPEAEKKHHPRGRIPVPHPGLLPRQQPWAPDSLHSPPSEGPAGAAHKHLLEAWTWVGRVETHGTDRPPSRPPFSI